MRYRIEALARRNWSPVGQVDNAGIDATLRAGSKLRLTITAADDFLNRPGVTIKISGANGEKVVEINESGELRVR